MISPDDDRYSTPRSDAWADLGGGVYTYYQEGTFAPKPAPADTSTSSRRRRRHLRAVDPDAQTLGTGSDVTATPEQIAYNKQRIAEIRADMAARAAGEVVIPESVNVEPVQQSLFDQPE